MSLPLNIAHHILFEDDFIIVLNKPAGLMVEPDRNGYPNLQQEVKRYLRPSDHKGEVYAQHLHRLDRPVSGVILFAKQKAVLKNLSEQFAEREVKKYYQALTTRTPDNRKGTLEHWLRKEKKKAALYESQIEFSEQAKLFYEVAEVSAQRYLWSIELHTGKYHQIRVQLAYINCPIIGDQLYGSEIPYKENAIALHAAKLIFQHPVTNREITMECKNPFV